MKVCIAIFFLLLLTSLLDVHPDQTDQGKNGNSMVDILLAKYLPDNNRVLLILGQDLDSVAAYQQSEFFPAPGGITTYLAFYHLNNPSYPAYGALGMDVDGNPVDDLVDWGAGQLNAYRAAVEYPESALVIGLNIAEGSGDNIWAAGGLADIAVGAYDKNIKRLADFCKTIKKPIYLRIGYEFDGSWNSGYEKKNSYILAFRHIVDVMRELGVSNVAYVWQASASPLDDVMDGQHESVSDWYPGNVYVDWMGFSWFLPPDEVRNNAPSQRVLADEVLNFARKKGKPVMIAEASPQGYNLKKLTYSNISSLWDGEAGKSLVYKTSEEIWQEWFSPFFNYIHANRDVIRAVAYINADWDMQKKWSPPYREGYWGDSRVQMNPDIRQRWLHQIEDSSEWLHIQ